MDRRMPAPPEATITRPPCPRWCINDDICLGEHEAGVVSIPATAGGPANLRFPAIFPTVDVGLWAYDYEGEPFSIVSFDADDSAVSSVKLRPREMLALAEDLTRQPNLTLGRAL